MIKVPQAEAQLFEMLVSLYRELDEVTNTGCLLCYLPPFDGTFVAFVRCTICMPWGY